MSGLAIFVTGFSSILTGLNFIVTVHTHACAGMTWFRCRCLYGRCMHQYYPGTGDSGDSNNTGAGAAGETVHLGIFDPAYGGDPVLFQHLFWFYSHPAVYIMFCHRWCGQRTGLRYDPENEFFGYSLSRFPAWRLRFSDFWFGDTTCLSAVSRYTQEWSFVPELRSSNSLAVKVFNWTRLCTKVRCPYDTPMLYAFGFIGLFTIGGMTGLFLAALGIDVHVTDTYLWSRISITSWSAAR